MTVYTAITFAPVQSFIEKSRKLRDLYGSSFLLSYLSKVICLAAENYNCKVISPAIINITQGTPNQIIIKGDFPLEEAEATFNKAWQTIVISCCEYIEELLPNFQYTWKKPWRAWGNYAWEFFHAQGTLAEVEEINKNLSPKDEPLTIITHVRCQLNQVKFSRNWTGINWMGESSTLSGADAIAYPGMGGKSHPKHDSMAVQSAEIKDFYEKLSKKVGEKIIDASEYLSIPELIKRLITLDNVASKLDLEEEELPSIEIPSKFSDLNRQSDNPEANRWTAWFQGDGDSIGQYLRQLREKAENQLNNKGGDNLTYNNQNQENINQVTNLSSDNEQNETINRQTEALNTSRNTENKTIKIEAFTENEANGLYRFSEAMLNWGKQLKYELPPSAEMRRQRQKLDADGKIIYAGGDDFLGVLYRNPPEDKLQPQEVLDWFYSFPEIWANHEIPITVSVGLVFAGHSVPQRDVLQHCRETEKLAKNKGRNRLAMRILFNSGNYLNWVCPWWFLQDILEGYRDREGDKNWTHFYNDINTLQSRHAFSKDSCELALSLLEIYFGKDKRQQLEEYKYGLPKTGEQNQINDSIYNGILGNYEMDKDTGKRKPIANSVINKKLNNWVIDLAKVGFHLFSSLNDKREFNGS